MHQLAGTTFHIVKLTFIAGFFFFNEYLLLKFGNLH